MINHGMVPAHLPDAFLREFDALRHKRLQAKADGHTDLANGLKIAINSIFGKSKSPYSWLCDPTVGVRTTLLGQLSLLWFIDALAEVEGVSVISANTDGLVLKTRRDLVEWVKGEMNRAAGEIAMSLSWAEYRLIARRDVNNYIAVTAEGKVKAKGSYGYDQRDLGRKATNRIVVKAVQAFFFDGTPLADTVRGCTDIREFLNYFKATKAYTIVDDTEYEHGQIARWYIGTAGVKLMKRKLVDGKLTQLVETGAVVVPDLPETFPADVNVDFYVSQAGTLVKAITEPTLRQSHTIPIAELSKTQRAALDSAKVGPADRARCEALNLEQLHVDWANVVRGNPHDTMLHLLRRLWVAERCQLTKGDLEWVADQLDEAGRAVPEKDRGRICDWIVRHISPFPVPRNIPEHVARAMTWATETIKPNNRKKILEHVDVLRSDFIKGDALERYEHGRDVYRLACSLCAICVKNAASLSERAICGIIEQIDAFLADEPSPDSEPVSVPASLELVLTP
jgi:hypothetical protein